LILNW